MTEAEDFVSVVAVQNAYGVAIDERDWPALRACFAPEASIGFGRPARTGTLDEFMDWAPGYHAPLGDTLHQNSTHRARFDGDAATASCYLQAILVDADGSAATPIFGRYDDELVRASGRWLIRRRRFRAVWRRRDPAADVPLLGGVR